MGAWRSGFFEGSKVWFASMLNKKLENGYNLFLFFNYLLEGLWLSEVRGLWDPMDELVHCKRSSFCVLKWHARKMGRIWSCVPIIFWKDFGGSWLEVFGTTLCSWLNESQVYRLESFLGIWCKIGWCDSVIVYTVTYSQH